MDFNPDTRRAAGYVAGIIDGEGAVYFRRTAQHVLQRRITVTNTDPYIVEAYSLALTQLKVTHYVRERSPTARGSRTWIVHISRREGIERLAEVVHLNSQRKQETLERILQSYPTSRRNTRAAVPTLLGPLPTDLVDLS
jgi:hypothetical protein